MGKNKARLILLNKSDLSDPAANRAWTAYFESLGFAVLEINARSGAGMKAIQGKVQEACREKIERDRKRGILNRPVRAMVAGIPNVGKSTFINSFAGKACAKTGNKPGVTKGKQWIRLNKGLELLDTPGILWPKFEDQAVGERLALIGSMNDEILNREEMALSLLVFIGENYPEALEKRYQLTLDTAAQMATHRRPSIRPSALLEAVCKSRGCLKRAASRNMKRARPSFWMIFAAAGSAAMTLELPKKEA